MSNNETQDPAKVISPKVIASLIVSAGLIVVGAMLLAITPEMFAGLGQWAPVVFAGVVTLGNLIAGYVKNDPLRR